MGNSAYAGIVIYLPCSRKTMNRGNTTLVDLFGSMSPAQRWVLVGATAAVLGAVALATGRGGVVIASKWLTLAIGGAIST